MSHSTVIYNRIKQKNRYLNPLNFLLLLFRINSNNSRHLFKKEKEKEKKQKGRKVRNRRKLNTNQAGNSCIAKLRRQELPWRFYQVIISINFKSEYDEMLLTMTISSNQFVYRIIFKRIGTTRNFHMFYIYFCITQ